MANIHPDIKPDGVSDKYLIDLMYMLQQSLYGLCLKLDNDATVPLTTYVANCYTAIFREKIEDYRGNVTQGVTTLEHIITPVGGLPAAALCQWLFDYANAFETLAEQLDTDGINSSTYEANCYHACIYPYMFEDKTGTIIGNDNSSGGFSTSPDGAPPGICTKIGPIGKPTDRVLCDLFYDFLNGWETLCEQLDTDGATTPPTDTNYEALWYTATVLMRVENSSGSILGNQNSGWG